jgi:hypothetical protein
MITTHFALNSARIVTCKGTWSMFWMKNKQMSNIVVEHYGSVSFHDEMANIIPQFFTIVDHETHGTTTTTTN